MRASQTLTRLGEASSSATHSLPSSVTAIPRGSSIPCASHLPIQGRPPGVPKDRISVPVGENSLTWNDVAQSLT